MSEWTLTKPVAFIIFNRPEQTRRVFAEIRKARPPKLFVIADGPRPNRPEDMEKCKATRAIIEAIDWSCEVFKNFSEVNLGCGVRPATGISWVFEHVNEAIILEDDCLPDQSFFRFCEELLDRYRDDTRIMRICGNNWKVRSKAGNSYYFSLYGHCWGWATWRRAWQYYDHDMKLLPEIMDNGLLDYQIMNKRTSRKWAKIFTDVYEHDKKHIWDYQWTFACWIQNGLSILPNASLISNIGFGDDATHSTAVTHRFSKLKLETIDFPLRHPHYLSRDYKAEQIIENSVFSPTIKIHMLIKLYKLIGRDIRDV